MRDLERAKRHSEIYTNELQSITETKTQIFPICCFYCVVSDDLFCVEVLGMETTTC